MKLKGKDFSQSLSQKSEKSLARGISYWLKHGDAGVQAEAQRVAEKRATTKAQSTDSK